MCFVLACSGLVTRLALASRPAVFLDRLFLPDDTYYTLTIARSIARGLGPTADGHHLTSGFQPLLAFLLVPILRVTQDPDVALRAALGIGAIADGVTAFLLGELARRISGSAFCAVVATAAWALSTAAIATSLNGLETSLALACTTGSLVLLSRAFEPRTASHSLAAHASSREGRPSPSTWLGLGLLLGTCLLARVDTVFFVVFVGLAILQRGGVRALSASAVAAATVVAPWWVYCIARFGTIVPESGGAVREQALAYKALGLNIRDQVAWGSGAVVGPPLFDSTWLRQALGAGASAIGFAVGIVLVVLTLSIARRRSFASMSVGQSVVVRILAAYTAALFLFYTFYLPATWFFRRYLVPVHLFSTLMLSLGATTAWTRRTERRRLWLTVVCGLAISGAASILTIVRFATTTPAMTVDREHHGAKGYIEPARQILALAPDGAVIGSLQSGALGWLAPLASKKVAVVNLDGVVDREAKAAFRERRLAAFARARGVTHICDWEFNVRTFLERSGDPRIVMASLRPIGEAEPQGEHERFVLYEIEWPND